MTQYNYISMTIIGVVVCPQRRFYSHYETMPFGALPKPRNFML